MSSDRFSVVADSSDPSIKYAKILLDSLSCAVSY